MTTHRTTPTGPAHIVIAGRAICSGSHATLPPGDAWPCRACLACLTAEFASARVTAAKFAAEADKRGVERRAVA